MLDQNGIASGQPEQSQPWADEVSEQLERLVSGSGIDAPARARGFLRYIVEETLAGRADRIKAYSVGTVVFGRDPNFDAQSDPVVRIEAGRLRRALESYYLTAGRQDPIIITIPKGAYVPHFAKRAADPPVPAPAALTKVDSPSPRQQRRSRALRLTTVAAFAAFLGGFAWWGESESVSQPPIATSDGRSPAGPTLAVVPFVNLGEIPEAKIYADGVTEEVLSQLARFKELSVLGRETSKSIPSGMAWAMLSILYLDEERFEFNRKAGSPAAAQRSLDAARYAIQLDPENARALQALMLALFFTEQPAQALLVGERAVALNPNDTELLGEFGARLGQAGDWGRGTSLLEQALARNPGHSGFYRGTLAVHAYMLRDYRRAEALIRQVSLDKFPLSHFVAAIIYAQLGKDREAAEARERFLGMRATFFDHWDQEVARRNYRPEDGAHLAEGARKAGFPVPRRTASEAILEAGVVER